RLFLSTQLATDPPHPAFSRHRLGDVSETATSSGRYRGRWWPDSRSGTHDYRCGLDGNDSFWFYPDDLRRLLHDLDFSIVSFLVADLAERGCIAGIELRGSPGN